MQFFKANLVSQEPRTARLLSLFALIGFVTALPAVAQDAREEIPKSARESMHLAYRHLISGNVGDLKRNTEAVGFFRKKAEETDNPQHRAKYVKLAEAYQGIAKINEAVVDGFMHGNAGPARKALEDLPGLEKTVEEITGKAVVRNWLTFAELKAYTKRFGTNYKTEAKGVFPFHKKHWDQQAIRQLQRDQSAK